MLKTFSCSNWNASITDSMQQDAIAYLENSKILYFPQLAFSLLAEEHAFLSPDYADPHTKNISYCPKRHRLWGVRHLADPDRNGLKNMLGRYAQYTTLLIQHLFPYYAQQLIIGRTSFRPVEIKHRKTSQRKDDKLLHVDAFPSAPSQGQRILRVFCNINPHGKARIWQIGEPFAQVAQRFFPRLSAPWWGSAGLLRILKITKSMRSRYDHYMLQIHDHMKADQQYQQTVTQQQVTFASDSTWIVQTDAVSHAILEGQYALEQTFCLPICAMRNSEQSPLKILERLFHRSLV